MVNAAPKKQESTNQKLTDQELTLIGEVLLGVSPATEAKTAGARSEKAKLILAAARRVAERGAMPNVAAVYDELRASGEYEKIGHGIGALLHAVMHASSIEHKHQLYGIRRGDERQATLIHFATKLARAKCTRREVIFALSAINDARCFPPLLEGEIFEIASRVFAS